MKRLALALIVLSFVAAASAVWLPDRLEQWTGETDPRFQAVGLLSSLTEPALTTADEAPLQVETSPYGVNVFLEQEVEEWKLHNSFELLKAAGVRWIRQQIPWSDIENDEKGDFEGPYGSRWAKYDVIVNMASEYGIKILARLDDPPGWSREDNRVHNRPPDDLNDYGDFVEAFVRRYRGKVDFIQIWNEPNIFPEWGWRPVDAQGYAELLKIAATRARAANPDVVIVAAALGPTDGTADGYNENDLVYLQKLYDAGASPYFDVMSAMGYSPWTGPGDRRTSADRVNFSRVRLIRDTMVRNGDERKPLWVAELGWNSLPTESTLTATHGRVTRERQAQYLEDAYRRAQEEWPWLGLIFAWHLRMVHDENRDQVLYYFGFADADFTLHPEYFAYQSMAKGPSVLGPGRKTESNPAIGVAGEWSYASDPRADGYYLKSVQSGDALAFTFRGSSLALQLHRGPGMGAVRIKIDGNPAPGLVDGRLSLAAENDSWTEIPIAVGLEDTDHRADIENAGGRVDFDGLVVRRSAGPLGAIMVALAVVLALAFGIVWSAAGSTTERLSSIRFRQGLARARKIPDIVWAGIKTGALAFSRRRSPASVSVRVPAELYGELKRDLPADRLQAFVTGAVADALRRLRQQSQKEAKQPDLQNGDSFATATVEPSSSGDLASEHDRAHHESAIEPALRARSD